MGRIISILLFSILAFNSNAQLIAKVELKDSVPGLCNQNEVYSLFDGFQGQDEAKCSLDRGQMEVLLNKNITYLKENPKFKSKGLIGVFISCDGDALQWEIESASESTELDEQILNLFQTFTIWSPGTVDDKTVDTRVLFSYTIKKGELILY